jgi:hypothetical protein
VVHGTDGDFVLDGLVLAIDAAEAGLTETGPSEAGEAAG